MLKQESIGRCKAMCCRSSLKKLTEKDRFDVRQALGTSYAGVEVSDRFIHQPTDG